MVDSSGEVILVADTNNHCIKRVHLTTGTVERVSEKKGIVCSCCVALLYAIVPAKPVQMDLRAEMTSDGRLVRCFRFDCLKMVFISWA